MSKARLVAAALPALSAVSAARFSFEFGDRMQAGFGEVSPEPENQGQGFLAWGEIGAGVAIGSFRPMAGVAPRSPTADRRIPFSGDTVALISVRELGVPLSLTWQPVSADRLFVREELCFFPALPGGESREAGGFRSETDFPSLFGLNAGAAVGWLFLPFYAGLAYGTRTGPQKPTQGFGRGYCRCGGRRLPRPRPVSRTVSSGPD